MRLGGILFLGLLAWHLEPEKKKSREEPKKENVLNRREIKGGGKKKTILLPTEWSRLLRKKLICV